MFLITLKTKTMEPEASLFSNLSVNIIDKNTNLIVTTVFEEESPRNGLDTLGPFFVGGFVALLLGWMLIRYKMSFHRASNYNGSVYCCPESCFQFCERPSKDSKTSVR